MPQPIRTLIVDDSAFARKVVREMLLTSPMIEVVGAARDGEEALELDASLKPDLVICDLRMPKLDGIGFVRQQMRRRPIPILILSAAAENADEVIDALSAGAIDVMRKPTALATDDLRAISAELVDKVLTIAHAPLANLTRAIPTEAAIPVAPRTSKVQIVVIGISTGGPQALRRMMPLFSADFPVPIAIVLHMPIGYTALFAEKLNEVCPLSVKEAAEGDLLRPGRVLLAQAGRHLSCRRTADGNVLAQLTMRPLEKLHRPSADVLFQSAAAVYGAGVLGVIMTGMGDDGKEGCAWVKAQGGTILTESERSCVIYGMPRSVEEAGLSDSSVPLDDMAQTIISRL
jgi:two-component system chemotaxis response regulator CheB